MLFFFLGNLFAQKEEKAIVKILSFNILHGKTTNGSFDLDIIANVIKKADADFVSLQEVDFKTNRAKKYDLQQNWGFVQKWLRFLEEQCIMMAANMAKEFCLSIHFYQPEMLLSHTQKETNQELL